MSWAVTRLLEDAERLFGAECERGLGCPRHCLEQYLTFCQSLAHFLRHAKGRLQLTQILVGK